ncbi:MAG: DUF6438 domain-containing protein [Candidatus Cyclobacteriaceae bacterium M2_1C_046]
MRILFVAVLAIIFFSCKSSKTAGQDDQKLLTMKRTACLGTCPVYEFTVFENRKVVYQGASNVPVEEKRTFKLKKKDFQQLKSLIKEADLFKYKDRYYQDNIHDLPTTYIYYYSDKQDKTIMDYYGAPDSLKKFETQVENLIFNSLK